MRLTIVIIVLLVLVDAASPDEYLLHRRKAFRTAAAGGGSASMPSGYYIWLKPESLSGSNGDLIETWLDSSPNTYTVRQGTAGSRPYLTNNFFDGLSAAVFDGVDDVLLTNSIAHGIGTGDFTWSVWVYPLAVTGSYKGMIGNASFSPGMYVRLSGAGNWGMYWGGDRVSGANLSANTWYHLITRRSGTTIDFWKNGVQEATTHTLATDMLTGLFAVGNSGQSGENANITVGEVALWARALTTQEIADLYSLRTP